MKIDDCIVSVERRTGGGCLDLAFVFVRRFARPIASQLLVFAVPSCLLTWLIARRTTDTLLLSLMTFSVFASLFSGVLIASAGPQVFGVRISTRAGLAGVWGRLGAFLFLTLFARAAQLAALVCFFLPAIFPTALLGHLNEVLLLEHTPVSGVMARLRNLARGNGFGRNLGRVAGLFAFWLICSAGLFILMDTLAAWLFNAPVLQGTILHGPDYFEALAGAVIDDPVVVVLIQVSMWLPFPVVRLAWFFCYLDQRIRNECWDLDLQFRAEAARLQGHSV